MIKQLLGKALSAVRDTLRESEAGLAHSDLPPFINFALRPRPMEFMTFHQRRPALWLWVMALTCQLTTVPRSWLSHLLYFHPSLALSECGPCLVGGTITLDDASLSTKIVIHNGAGTLAPFGWLPFLDTVFYLQTFIRRDGFESHGHGWCGIRRVRAEMRPSLLGGALANRLL